MPSQQLTPSMAPVMAAAVSVIKDVVSGLREQGRALHPYLARFRASRDLWEPKAEAMWATPSPRSLHLAVCEACSICTQRLGLLACFMCKGGNEVSARAWGCSACA